MEMTLSLNDVPLTPSSSLALVFFPNKHVAVQRTAHIYLSHVIFFIFLLLSLSLSPSIPSRCTFHFSYLFSFSKNTAKKDFTLDSVLLLLYFYADTF